MLKIITQYVTKAIKKAEHWRVDAFELWSWRRLLRVPWTARRLSQSVLKEISPEYSLEGLMLKPDAKSWLIWKDPDAGKDWRQENGMTEDETVGWHHWLDGHEFEQAPGVSDGQGGLACCGPCGHKESDMTEWLNWTDVTICSSHKEMFQWLEKLAISGKFLGIFSTFKIKVKWNIR